jgi:NitT/TauT family transport system substrate-binding protein
MPTDPSSPARRRALSAAAGLALAPLCTVSEAAPARRARLTLAGPPGPVSAPLMHLADSGALADLADAVTYMTWRDPDQLRALTLEGRADVLAVPTNVAANLFNRGVPVTLLGMVSRAAGKKTLADFKGEEIAMPFRGDMPDLVFQLLAARQGLDVKRDFRLRYVPTPMEAMQLLITRRVDHALLADSAVAMALRKTRSFPLNVVAPELHRSVDLQQEWGRLFSRRDRMPQAGIAVIGDARQDAALMQRVQAAYAQSMAWCRGQPPACGQLVARHVDLLLPEAVADAVAVERLEAVPAATARPELEFFFQQLMSINPALVGGKLPGGAFYGSPS